MSAATAPPDDDDLRGFLLGTLPPDRVERVRAWLDADPAHAARLDRLTARDALTDSLTDDTADESVPPDTVERVVRAVSNALNMPASGTAETRAPGDDGGTVPQLRAPVPEPAPAWPPTRLGGYRVVRELGHGGMGYVFEAEDETLGRRVAVKVLTPDLAERPDAAARFLREARAAAAVDHDNVVPVLHVGDEAGTPYMVMPLLQGESLADRLKRGSKLPVAQVVRVGRDVAAGLGAAHLKGLVHRDLKPANVWLDAGTGRARVLDFGLARQGDGADALTQAGALLGTPAYMSPEQLDGQPASARSDLFALGAVLYECATGARAFNGPTITAILKAVSDHHPPAPADVNPDVPATLSALIVRLLAKNPAGRPASAADVLAALASAPVSSAASGATTGMWVDRAARVPKRAVWIVGGVAVLALVAAGVWLGTGPPAAAVVENTPPKAEPPVPVPDPPKKVDPPAPVRYRGKIEVLVERTVPPAGPRLLRLNEAGALPLRQSDKFRIEGEVEPPAYLYVVWVDPDRDITPVYPWNVAKGWGSRPAAEKLESVVSLPPNKANRYTAPAAKPGVATMVLIATATPLTEPDEVLKGWFEGLPNLPLPSGGEGVAVWYDDFAPTTDPLRLRAGLVEVESDDAFARWQGQLQKSLGGKASFQTAVSFARTGRK